MKSFKELRETNHYTSNNDWSPSITEKMGPVKKGHYNVLIISPDAKTSEKIHHMAQYGEGDRMDIDDVDTDGVQSASGYIKGKIRIEGDDAGKLGLLIQKKFRKAKVTGE